MTSGIHKEKTCAMALIRFPDYISSKIAAEYLDGGFPTSHKDFLPTVMDAMGAGNIQQLDNVSCEGKSLLHPPQQLSDTFIALTTR